MNEQELQAILKDTQEILLRMDDRLQLIEKQQSETKDYSDELAKIDGRLEQVITLEALSEQIASTNSQIEIFGSDVLEIKEQQTEQGRVLKEMPKQTKFQIEHRFTDRQRPYIIMGIVLLLVWAVSIFASFQLWRSNSTLHDSDIKIRMVRLFYPQVSLDIDSIYNNNPEKLELWVKQEEERLIAIRKAREGAEQSEEQAKRAKKELQRLQEQKGN